MKCQRLEANNQFDYFLVILFLVSFFQLVLELEKGAGVAPWVLTPGVALRWHYALPVWHHRQPPVAPCLGIMPSRCGNPRGTMHCSGQVVAECYTTPAQHTPRASASFSPLTPALSMSFVQRITKLANDNDTCQNCQDGKKKLCQTANFPMHVW